jgi:hypothetical protein
MKWFLGLIVGGLVLGAIFLVLVIFTATGSVDATTGNNSCASAAQGVLPGAVPKPYNGIFTAASAKWKIDPALEAAIFMSEHGNSWPDPNSVQATSPMGAMGWFQFMPGTWAGYSNSNPAHPNGDPQDLTDAAYAAAHYLSDLGGIPNMQPGDPDSPQKGTVAAVAGGYNNNYRPYMVNAVKQFLRFKDGSGDSTQTASQDAAAAASVCDVPVNADGLVNPFLHVPTLCPHRIDMGVDYCGAGTIGAIGHAYVYASSTTAGWPGGGFVGLKLLDPPYAGKYVFIAEHIKPLVQVEVRPGQPTEVQPGQAIATMYDGYPWIEMGWASGVGYQTLAASLNQQMPVGDPGGWMSAAGASFNRLLIQLGVPSGTSQPGGEHGTMPVGYP